MEIEICMQFIITAPGYCDPPPPKDKYANVGAADRMLCACLEIEMEIQFKLCPLSLFASAKGFDKAIRL